MKHGDEVWVRGTWVFHAGRMFVEVKGDPDGRVVHHVHPMPVDWMPDPNVHPPMMDQLTAEADLRGSEADDREFRDRCAVAAMQGGYRDAGTRSEVRCLCVNAFSWADEMVAERRRRDGR